MVVAQRWTMTTAAIPSDNPPALVDRSTTPFRHAQWGFPTARGNFGLVLNELSWCYDPSNPMSLNLSVQGQTIFRLIRLASISDSHFAHRCFIGWHCIRCATRRLVSPAPSANRQPLSPFSGHKKRPGHWELCASVNVVGVQLSLPHGQRYSKFSITPLNCRSLASSTSVAWSPLGRGGWRHCPHTFCSFICAHELQHSWVQV
jgi:hypothetical protein